LTANERASHEIEYVNEVCVAFIDFLLLRGLLPALRPASEDRAEYDALWDKIGGVFIFCAFLFALVQLVIYNTLSNGEQDSHWMEFVFGIVAGIISFWFCMDNKFISENRVEALICGCNTGHHAGL